MRLAQTWNSSGLPIRGHSEALHQRDPLQASPRPPSAKVKPIGVSGCLSAETLGGVLSGTRLLTSQGATSDFLLPTRLIGERAESS